MSAGSLPPPPPGFRIVRRIGAGTAGQVFLGIDLTLNRRVALKRLPLRGDHDRARELAVHEGRAVAQLHSEHIAQVYDILAEHDAIWLIEEYVSGQSLQALIASGAAIPRSRAHLWIRQVAAGLGVAHGQGVLHRDVKPANVMIDQDWNARLVDFGVAATSQGSRVAALLDGAGTPAYMAPEVARRQSASDRSDVYAVGIIAYQLYVGRHPLAHHAGNVDAMVAAHATEEPVSPHRVDGSVSRRLAKQIMAALAKDPQGRPDARTFVARWDKAL